MKLLLYSKKCTQCYLVRVRPRVIAASHFTACEQVCEYIHVLSLCEHLCVFGISHRGANIKRMDSAGCYTLECLFIQRLLSALLLCSFSTKKVFKLSKTESWKSDMCSCEWSISSSCSVLKRNIQIMSSN